MCVLTVASGICLASLIFCRPWAHEYLMGMTTCIATRSLETIQVNKCITQTIMFRIKKCQFAKFVQQLTEVWAAKLRINVVITGFTLSMFSVAFIASVKSDNFVKRERKFSSWIGDDWYSLGGQIIQIQPRDMQIWFGFFCAMKLTCQQVNKSYKLCKSKGQTNSQQTLEIHADVVQMREYPSTTCMLNGNGCETTIGWNDFSIRDLASKNNNIHNAMQWMATKLLIRFNTVIALNGFDKLSSIQTTEVKRFSSRMARICCSYISTVKSMAAFSSR